MVSCADVVLNQRANPCRLGMGQRLAPIALSTVLTFTSNVPGGPL